MAFVCITSAPFRNLPILLLSWSILFSSCEVVTGHAVLGVPNQRGSLATTAFVKGVDENAPKDFKAHFPAGSKDVEPGAGARSQIKAAGATGWTPFRPLEKNFKWRSGVCGDLKGPCPEHIRGGRFYYGGKVVRIYTLGGILAAQVNMVANHNGFFEFHICDVKKCGGEISESCFRNGHCRQLQRAPNPDCDHGNNPLCGPIDPHYPGRWYIPCSRLPHLSNYGREYLGGNTMLFKLPEDITCEHCVLQWFWSTGNTCNAPGVIEYFEGPNRPRWGKCIGQAGAIGGFSRWQKPCGSDRFPEEYLQCADIAIDPRILRPSPLMSGSPAPALDEDFEDRPGESVSQASPELEAPFEGEQPTDLKGTSNPTSEHSTMPTPGDGYWPSSGRNPNPTPQSTQEFAIPEGYPMGIYPPKRG